LARDGGILRFATSKLTLVSKVKRPFNMKALAAVIVLGFLFMGKCNDSNEAPIPPCILEKIETIKSEHVWSPAAKVWRITTADHKIFYYIPTHCCDFYSELYDERCNLLCNPDGGLAGKGNGVCPEYQEKETKLIWQDDRGE
jgi:hypothetical protein